MSDSVRSEEPARPGSESRSAKHGFPGRPVDHLHEVFKQAVQAAPPKARRILVLTHRGPDPDALGACEGLRRLCSESFDIETEVATAGRIHRAENKAMVRTLELELSNYFELDHSRFCGVALVDSQPEFGHTVVPDDIPTLAIFDHHVPPAENPSTPKVPIPHLDIRLGLGATSSIIYEYLRDAGIELDQRTASALFCGVRYDTADLSRNASPLDEEAYYETFRHADRPGLARINHPPLPRGYYNELHRALGMARQHGALMLALMGRIESPEFVAEMADFMLRMKGCSWVVVGGAYGGEYVLSLRTDYAFGKAYPLMARVLDGAGSFGGHGHIAGGRITLDDQGESTIKSVERTLRANALGILGSTAEDSSTIPMEGRPLT
jgi:nanoRNase/pAp phosphatase (c-di-AMP/oligoRNAs hydrolase)